MKAPSGRPSKQEMRLWQRASGALKDQNSIFIAGLSRRTALRNPDIEAAVIRATSHNDSSIDYRNAQRIYTWVRMSPAFLKPIVWSISIRLEKTRSWVVALKGLMLMHGVFCCKEPAVQMIGRLPFDLSNFKDGHSNPGKTWGLNVFVRAYYAFLDRKSTFLFLNSQERKGRRRGSEESTLMQDLVRLQKLQGLVDMLFQIKPQAHGMIGTLVLEAMDCVIIEIFDMYSIVCNGIARVLVRIYSAGKVEAAMALKVLQKATEQGEELSLYFEVCRDIGVINASECPKIEQIPEEDIRELEDIINGVSEKSDMNRSVPQEEKAIVLREDEQKYSKSSLKTIVTDNWEVFDEDSMKINGESRSVAMEKSMVRENPFAVSLIPSAHHHVYAKSEDLPDLISFL
ncbi:unnamed protein product [Ilex paraguariensis]|uniref:ENTH domain-containing protein n=1 Tax=Ilex paraguariensis TaxID=185542 RepID=A0ABC8SU48_9AQUA